MRKYIIFQGFKYTGQVSIPYTASDDVLIKKATKLFDKLYELRMLIRLIGVKFGNLIRGLHQINILIRLGISVFIKL